MGVGMMYDVTSFTPEAWTRLGDAIKRRRIARGLTQEQLADKAECAPGTIRNLERGKRGRLLTLPRIARALGWTEDSYLLVLEGGEPVDEVTPTPPQQNDALRIDRPADMPPEHWDLLRARADAMSPDEWDALKSKMISDLELWLRYRGR